MDLEYPSFFTLKQQYLMYHNYCCLNDILRLIFGNMICCSTLRLRLFYPFYLCMFFNSIKEINRSRKEINRVLRKGMSSIFLKVTIEKKWDQFFKFKKFVSRSIFGDLQLTQIPLNFQSCYWNLKIRGLGKKLCLAFSIIFILKGIMTF